MNDTKPIYEKIYLFKPFQKELMSEIMNLLFPGFDNRMFHSFSVSIRDDIKVINLSFFYKKKLEFIIFFDLKNNDSLKYKMFQPYTLITLENKRIQKDILDKLNTVFEPYK